MEFLLKHGTEGSLGGVVSFYPAEKRQGGSRVAEPLGDG